MGEGHTIVVGGPGGPLVVADVIPGGVFQRKDGKNHFWRIKMEG